MSSSSVEQCALCADSMHDVHHAIVEVNVVIGVLVVHCELLVVRVVPAVVDDAVVRRALVLIAFTVAFVFFVAILHRILLYWRKSVHTWRTIPPPLWTVRWLLAWLTTCSNSVCLSLPHLQTSISATF